MLANLTISSSQRRSIVDNMMRKAEESCQAERFGIMLQNSDWGRWGTMEVLEMSFMTFVRLVIKANYKGACDELENIHNFLIKTTRHKDILNSSIRGISFANTMAKGILHLLMKIMLSSYLKNKNIQHHLQIISEIICCLSIVVSDKWLLDESLSVTQFILNHMEDIKAVRIIYSNEFINEFESIFAYAIEEYALNYIGMDINDILSKPDQLVSRSIQDWPPAKKRLIRRLEQDSNIPPSVILAIAALK